MEKRDIVDGICGLYCHDPQEIATKEYGQRNPHTYEELILKIVNNPRYTVTEVFPEFSRATTSKLLNAAFPGKEGGTWYSYLLSLVNLYTCKICGNEKKYDDIRCYHCEKEYLSKNKGKISVRQASWYKENIDKCKAQNLEYRLKNKELIKERKHLEYLKNKGRYAANSIKYKNRKRVATPKWADMEKINLIYANCPEGYHVDHVIPLNGTLVSGLHVENNLQYLTKEENMHKGNSYTID